MKDEVIRQKIHRAVDAHGAALRENPFLAQRIIAQSCPDRKEAPRMKKLSTGAIIAIVLMLLSATALAVGLTAEELAKVEAIVNTHVLAAEQGSMTEMPLEEAKKLGALALFGEKYGKVVRVVRMGDFSTEFCGGTHVDSTGKIGLFRILSESGKKMKKHKAVVDAVAATLILETYLNSNR